MRKDDFSELLKDDKDCVLRPYLLNYNLTGLVSLFQNIFGAVKEVWPNEWDNHQAFILSKTTGYNGLMRKAIIPILQFGYLNKNLKREFFVQIFNQMKLDLGDINLTKEAFPPGSIGEKKFEDFVSAAFEGIKETIPPLITD